MPPFNDAAWCRSLLPDHSRMDPLPDITLDDKWTLDRGRVYMSGTQALVRLLMLQRVRDARAGLNTAGFLTGYRGSPMGGVDQTAWRAKKFLDAQHIRFQPAVNEDLGATSLWGTQQANLAGQGKYDGVFGLWYGKGPGVARCGDVFSHASAAGTGPHGGVLVAAGDDHAARSSTLAHQSDYYLKSALMPVLYPASVQEVLDLGLHGYAMSRYAGVWVGFKCVTDIVESSASVTVDPERVEIALPEDFALPPGGLSIRWPDPPLSVEARLLDYKLTAAVAYCRANRLNRTIIDAPGAQFGIVAAGKAYADTRTALAGLGLDDATCARIGIRLFKCSMVWPLEVDSITAFAEGLTEILVVEEKRGLLEEQIKEALFNAAAAGRRVPRVVGKFDETSSEWAAHRGLWLLPANYELSPARVAQAIAARLRGFDVPGDVRATIEARLAQLAAKERALARPRVVNERPAYFCSGCPHNTSTVAPEGSRTLGGIGCHYLALFMDRATETFTQMGGEGASWIGQAPFTNEKHVFVNLGDGTYFHSGSLAVRAAIAADVPITYKILFNDAVAMTGGQPTDGALTVPRITQQMHAEGVRRIVVVTDEPDKYDKGQQLDHSASNAHGAVDDAWQLAPGVSVRHRDELDRVQRELRETAGVSVLIYDQTCATEKRRRRKRNEFPDPPRRVVINELVCEGCGDCGTQSNCLSVEPVDTEFGRKRRINQSSCNKDFSCVKGFCPSFVTVEGGRLRKVAAPAGPTLPGTPLPLPQIDAALDASFNILVTGIGGTGVVTIGQWLGMAAHIEGRGVSVLDMTGIAQKGGAVTSHVQIARAPEDLNATRIAMASADLLLGCDLIVSASNDTLARLAAGRSRAIVNTAEAPTGESVRNPQWQFAGGPMQQHVREAIGTDAHCAFVDASRVTIALMGDAIYTNPFVLGMAWQKGWIPLRYESLKRAIELNGVAVDANLRAFEWGRAAAHDLPAVLRAAEQASAPIAEPAQATTIEGIVARRVNYLTAYQNAAYAQRYAAFVEEVRKNEAERLGTTRLAETVARNYFKLLAYKDEYEVARLHSDPAFRARIVAQFEGDYRLNFYLAPPLWSRPDPVSGRIGKKRYGPWVLTAFALLARLKFLRGSALDAFGRTKERLAERALPGEYEVRIRELLPRLGPESRDTALQIASVPESIRGFGGVKEESLRVARAEWERLRGLLRA
jgi:indolepyruvate ferredoxin oxidoreductase